MMRRIHPDMNILEAMKFNGILSMGFYDEHLGNYLKYFDRNQMLVLTFENDLLKNKNLTIQRIYKYLEIDDTFVPKNLSAKSNPRAGSLYMRLNYFSNNLGRAIKYLSKENLYYSNFWPINIDNRDKHTLNEIYSVHNKYLEELLEIQLPW